MHILLSLILSTVFALSPPETAMKIVDVDGGTAITRLYSTVEQSATYDLYTIKKVNGKWEKDAYIRTIDFPEAKHERKGKYKYYSKRYYVEHLEWGHVYALFPTEKGNHPSVPFWKKPLKRRGG